jgi:serine protease Do
MDPWSQALISALDKVRPTVVQVMATDPERPEQAFGTGVMLDNYHVITSAPVVNKRAEITIKLQDGKKIQAACVGIDPLYYVAVLRAESRLPADIPRYAPEGTAPVGLFVFACGYALGLEHTAATGFIASADRTIYRPERFPVDGLIITNAQIHPGNAGGPLCDLEGRVVGINVMPWQGGMCLALQAAVAARVANQIIDYGLAVHPWLGFSGEPEQIDKTWVDLFDLPSDTGVVVHFVNPSGPAARAGLQEMDMVMQVDGRAPVRGVGQIRKVLAWRKHGEQVPITVLRSGNLMEMMMPVEEIPHLAESLEADEEEEPS